MKLDELLNFYVEVFDVNLEIDIVIYLENLELGNILL